MSARSSTWRYVERNEVFRYRASKVFHLRGAELPWTTASRGRVVGTRKPGGAVLLVHQVILAPGQRPHSVQALRRALSETRDRPLFAPDRPTSKPVAPRTTGESTASTGAVREMLAANGLGPAGGAGGPSADAPARHEEGNTEVASFELKEYVPALDRPALTA